MKKRKWLHPFYPKKRKLSDQLNRIIALFFLFPVTGFLYFGIKHDLLQEQEVPLFFLGLLVFTFCGAIVLRKLFDEISTISSTLSRKTLTEPGQEGQSAEADELNTILHAFNTVEARFQQTIRKLQKKVSEVSVLKELSELCYVTFDPEEILQITLERALILTAADVGSVIIRDPQNPNQFIVRASIGLGDVLKIGDRIDFDTSVAKYAVINKSPVVVADIETDRRFSRISRPHYGTKSFVCMPIKTSSKIVGVLTISSKTEERVFTREVVEVLTPLISNASFSYETLRLLKENEKKSLQLETVNNIYKVINSTIHQSELLKTVMNELRRTVPFHMAMVMSKDPKIPDQLVLTDLITNDPLPLNPGQYFSCNGTFLDRAVRLDSTLVVDSLTEASQCVEKQLFADHGFKSCIVTPLKSNGRVSGVLILCSKARGVYGQQKDLLEWVANGLCVEYNRRRVIAALGIRDKELETIKQIGSVLASSTFNFDRVLKYTLDMIQVTMDVEAGIQYLVADKRLSVVDGFNISIDSSNPFYLEIGQGLAGFTAARGESLMVNDVAQSLHFTSEIDDALGITTRSSLCVPLIIQGEVMGVIELINKTNGEFEENDRDLLHSIASSVSIALENSRLYNETVIRAENEHSIRRMFQKFVPKEILDQIIHHADDPRPVLEEFKTVTLLNIDLRDFSAVAKNIGPRKTVSLLNVFFGVMGAIIFKHSGIVDKYLGDGFLAVFGAPLTTPSDADNALKAALEMKAAMPMVNERYAKDFGLTLDMGISIHTGEVVAGNIGFDMKMDYTVIGEAANTVFRLQELTKARQNCIIVSQTTCRATREKLSVTDVEMDPAKREEIGALNVYELEQIHLKDTPSTV